MLFKRKRSHGAGINANGWMISYADMVTILLAMFIVLSTLSKDQTGLSLYYGTGSYRKAVKNFGMPGVSANTDRTIQMATAGPRYNVENPNEEGQGSSTDRVIDAEEENFQHYLSETKKDVAVDKTPKEAGRSSVDFHSKLGTSGPLLNSKQRDLILPLLIMAQQKGYSIEVVVWAPTPAETACTRSINTAIQLRAELVTDIGATVEVANRIVAVGQPWRFKNIRRPIFSIVVAKAEPKK